MKLVNSSFSNIFTVKFVITGGHSNMSMRSMDSRLEVLRNGQDIANKSLLYSAGPIQQPQQQLPNADVDNESNKCQ